MQAGGEVSQSFGSKKSFLSAHNLFAITIIIMILIVRTKTYKK
jgi:hypothetical protein